MYSFYKVEDIFFDYEIFNLKYFFIFLSKNDNIYGLLHEVVTDFNILKDFGKQII